MHYFQSVGQHLHLNSRCRWLRLVDEVEVHGPHGVESDSMWGEATVFEDAGTHCKMLSDQLERCRVDTDYLEVLTMPALEIQLGRFLVSLQL